MMARKGDVRAAAVAIGLALAVSAAWAVPDDPKTTPMRQGNGEQGRKIFNGKGICFYCHGRDGYLDQRPLLTPDTAALIDRLDPKPADLRSPSSLKMKTDKERFRAIREGHEGTGMFPDPSLTDQEIRHTLAYLSVLRKEAVSKGKSEE